MLVDCGSICSAIEHATGRRPDITLGKPDPNMLSGILRRHGLRAEEIAMAGDRIYTDIEMAHNAGALGVLVLSGETTLDVADRAPRQPELIAEHIGILGELLQEAREHPIDTTLSLEKRSVNPEKRTDRTSATLHKPVVFYNRTLTISNSFQIPGATFAPTPRNPAHFLLHPIRPRLLTKQKDRT